MADQRRVTQLGIESDVDAGTATKRNVTQLGLESDVDSGLATKRKITQLGLESDVDAGLVTERKVTQLLLEVDVEAVYHTYVSGVAMPDYAGDERGIPLAGDRAAWDVVDYPEHHARDLKDDAPVHHVPAGQSVGDVLVWDGSKWVREDDAPIGLHASTHEDDGADEISVAGLSGQLADGQTPVNHDHSGDAGDGGTFDAANLTSGAATDGQVLTADGSGGAAWEDAPGSPLTVEEQDGTPSIASVEKIRVTNGTLTDEGDGIVKLDFGSAATDSSAIHDNVAEEIHAVAEKATPADDDELLIEDSADLWAKKRATVEAVRGNVQEACINVVIDGGGSAITAGIKCDLEVPFGCTINRATLLADQDGDIVVDIWVDTYANFPPTVADTITAAAKPTLAAADSYQDATLTGWTTALAAGSIMRVNVDSAATLTRVTLSLKVTRS